MEAQSTDLFDRPIDQTALIRMRLRQNAEPIHRHNALRFIGSLLFFVVSKNEPRQITEEV